MNKLNLPNRLTLLRLIMVPACIAVALIPPEWLAPDVSSLIAGLIFVVASLTDMLDGKIARKYNLVTDFGKFLDPLADKFMVIGAMMAILYRFDNIRPWFFWAVLIVVFREFAVTSMRLVVSTGNGIVIAAGNLGKIKTTVQIICICCAFFEPLFYPDGFILAEILPLTAVSTALTVFFTVWSGADYIVKYWKYLDSGK